MNKIARKVIVWGLIIVLGLPNIILGTTGLKVFGLVLVGTLIWWDVVAGKREPKK